MNEQQVVREAEAMRQAEDRLFDIQLDELRSNGPAQYGNLYEQVRAVIIMSLQDYIDTIAPTPAWLKSIGDEHISHIRTARAEGPPGLS